MEVVPTEILIDVLVKLPAPNIVRSREVCRRWLEVIASSLLLQYQIELYAQAKIDNPFVSMPTSERLDLIRKSGEGWRRLEFVRRDTYSLSSLSFLDGVKMSGGILYKPIPSAQKLWIGVLASSLHKSRPFPKDIDNISLSRNHFVLDATQDLIVEGQEIADPVRFWTLHFRTISSYEAHPLAARATIIPPFSSQNLGPLFGVNGDLLAGTASDESGISYSAFILKWTTGELMARIQVGAARYNRIVPLPDHHFIVPSYRSRADGRHQESTSASIEVYDFKEGKTKCIATFQLPAMHARVERCHLGVHSSSPSHQGFSGTFHSNGLWGIPKPITDSPDEHLLTFRFWASWMGAGGRGEESSNIHILTHVSTLLAYCTDKQMENPIHVPWEKWGLEGTRCFSTAEDNEPNFQIYGQRAVHIVDNEPGFPSLDTLCLCDFNQIHVRRILAHHPYSPERRESPLGTIVCRVVAEEGEEVTFGAFESGSITGRLPYFKTTLLLGSKGVRRVLLDEEHIALVNVHVPPMIAGGFMSGTCDVLTF